jgi:hypothetical protein
MENVQIIPQQVAEKTHCIAHGMRRVGEEQAICLGPLRELAFAFCGIYLASLIALFSIGLRPVVPWNLALIMLFICAPFGVLFFWYSKRQTNIALDFAVSPLVLVLYNYLIWWPIMAVLILLFTKAGTIRWEWKLMLLGIATMILGYGTLWNFNYLLAHYVPPVYDPSLRVFDEWFYSWFISSVSYTGLFPIVHNSVLIQLLNNAYAILFAEVFLVFLLICHTRDAAKVSEFLKVLFAFYFSGVLCFLIFPAIGPCLYYPESIDPTRAHLRFMAGMLHDYETAIHGGALDGYGYFIAIPSLHVMIAIFLQNCFAGYPNLFRFFMPINCMLILSTFLLGYHYVLDAFAGMIIMGIWMLLKQSKFFISKERSSNALAQAQ